ncbi:MAG: potassium transporter TrkA [Myxococcaceae bacterium]|nr:potassium transporter TrkA [Myxococcaceae bacterium]
MANEAPDAPSTGDKIRYQVDRFLSWSPLARFIGLFGISFILISIGATVSMFVLPPDPEKPHDFLEQMWWALTRVADAGTMGDDTGTAVRAVAIFSTLSGVFVVALLIGLVSSTIGDKLEDLRKGNSPVIDENHTLILGWGEKVFAILRELREANASLKHASVVILSYAPKEEVEEAVRERMGDMRTTRVVVRQGSTYDPHDLKKVGAGRARSIIILASDTAEEDGEASEDADMSAIKTLLALRRIPGALTKNHATVELIDSARKQVVEQLGNGGVEVVAMEETLSRMMVQTSRQNGLAEVYRGLLSYEGSEFYFKSFPELAGKPFGDAQWKMKDAVVVGYRRPEHGETPAATILNPKDEVLLEATDELLVIAEDDDSFSLTAAHAPELPEGFKGATPMSRQPERLLVCGNSPKLGDMLREYDNYVLPGSEAWLMPNENKEGFTDFIKAEVGSLKNLKLKYVEGDPTNPAALKKVASPDFYCALIVADTSQPEDEADAHTVMTVLLMRDLFKDLGDKKPRIISEILDPRTKDLLEQDYGADFVVSSEMTSMLLAQISERRDLNAVFADLFDSDGNEVYLKRAACYVELDVPSNWMAVQKMARVRGEVAIGYMKAGQPPLINPPQSDTQPYVAEDRIIVLSEDDSEALGDQRGGEFTADPMVPDLTPPSPRYVAAPAPAPVAPPAPAARAPSALVPPQPRPLEATTVTAGPRVAGPSTQPRAPLPPKPKA